MTTPPNAAPGLPHPQANQPLATGAARWLLIALAILILLAGTSFLTTVIYTNGDLPSGMYRLHVRNAAGRPIQGALLKAFDGRLPAQGYFLPNDLTVSDAQGTLEFVKDAGQARADNLGWNLFWLYPILPAGASRIYLEISAPGYATLAFTEADLFKVALRSHGGAPKTKAQTYNGTIVDVALYELDVTLQAKK